MLHAYSSLYLELRKKGGFYEPEKNDFFTDLIRKPRPFRGDFVMWLEIILIFPFFVFRKTEMF